MSLPLSRPARRSLSLVLCAVLLLAGHFRGTGHADPIMATGPCPPSGVVPVNAGQFCWRTDVAAMFVWDGTTWQQLAVVVGSPVLNASALATLPAAGTAGRLRRVTDSVSGVWMDTGTAWQLIGPTAFTAGSVTFTGTNGSITQNNAALFWDNTNLRLGIGLNNPGALSFDVKFTDAVGTAGVTNVIANVLDSLTGGVGNRTGLLSRVDIPAGSTFTPGVGDGSVVGGSFQAQAAATMTNLKVFGANPVAQITGGTVTTADLVGQEVNVSAKVAVNRKVGVQVVTINADSNAGTGIDAAFLTENAGTLPSTAKWLNGLWFRNGSVAMNGNFVLATDSGGNTLVQLRQINAGGQLSLAKQVATSGPGTNLGSILFLAGTTAGTAKLVVCAGTSTVCTVVVDNIGGGF